MTITEDAATLMPPPATTIDLVLRIPFGGERERTPERDVRRESQLDVRDETQTR